jgi:hypothetical protein
MRRIVLILAVIVLGLAACTVPPMVPTAPNGRLWRSEMQGHTRVMMVATSSSDGQGNTTTTTQTTTSTNLYFKFRPYPEGEQKTFDSGFALEGKVLNGELFRQLEMSVPPGEEVQ